MIDRLTAVLRQAGLDPTAREIADALWLAASMGPAVPPGASSVEVAPPVADPGRAAEARDEEPKVPAKAPRPGPAAADRAVERSAGVFPEGGPGAKSGGIAFRSPTATALPGALALGRALRPLKRQVPSRNRVELDEAATADRLAQGVRPAVVVRPAPTRWLDLELVIDDAPSMSIWRQTVIELRTLLVRQGAFRNVRVYQLVTDDGRALGLFAGAPGGARRKVSERELFDPSGRRLVLLVSDCVAPAWDDGRVGALVDAWGRHGPVAVAQVLPERLWQRSGLGASERVRLRAATPGAPNACLAAERLASAFGLGEALAAVTAVPVVELNAASMSAWARMLAGARTSSGGVLLPSAAVSCEASSPEGEAPEDGLEPSAEERVARFRSMATREARKLARLFAAAPLSLPVMRLIRETMAPEATLGHLAEVFLGGLLREVVEEDSATGPEYMRYDFFQGVRERLLDSASAEEAVSVLERVSEYVIGHLGSTLDFRAWLADPAGMKGNEALAPADQPFAAIGAEVLRRLGGEYALLGDRLARRPGAEGQDAVLLSYPATETNSPARDGRERISAVEVPAEIEPESMMLDARLSARIVVYARKYERIRRKMDSGQERTAVLDDLVADISREIRLDKRMTAALMSRFQQGGAGERLVVLAILLTNPDPGCFEAVRSGIAERVSRFEQYTALRVAAEMLPALDREQTEVLRQALIHERSGAKGTWINEQDTWRWRLSGRIIEAIEGPRQVLSKADLAHETQLKVKQASPTRNMPAPGVSATPQLALRFISGKYQGDEFPLGARQEIVVGRAFDLDMVLVEDMVSRRHARITCTERQIVIEDLGSTNGTFVNGDKIQKTTLKEGDRVLIGTSILKVVSIGPGASPERPRTVEKVPERSGNRRGQARSMSGALDEIPLPDLLQLFGSSKKSGILVVRSDDDIGKIYLRKGIVTFAIINDLAEVPPLKSVYRILTWAGGTFDLEPAEERIMTSEISVTAQELLMEGLRQVDELNNLRKKLPDPSARLVIPRPLKPLLRDLSPVDLDVVQNAYNHGHFMMVLNKSPAPDLEIAQSVLKLLDKGYLRVDRG